MIVERIANWTSMSLGGRGPLLRRARRLQAAAWIERPPTRKRLGIQQAFVGGRSLDPWRGARPCAAASAYLCSPAISAMSSCLRVQSAAIDAEPRGARLQAICTTTGESMRIRIAGLLVAVFSMSTAVLTQQTIQPYLWQAGMARSEVG